MDNRGRESGVKKDKGKARARRTRGLEQGERDSKPITIGQEKAFHPKTVTTHANIHTSISLSPAYKNSTNAHTWSDIFLYHSFTHVFRAPFKQMHY